MSRCRSCQAPIIWAETEKARRLPLDAEPFVGADAHLYVVRERIGRPPLAVGPVPVDAFPGEAVFRSHFRTCPDANDWSRHS